MSVEILRGDCREVLRSLADESVHCIVTSPPYWGLRDYGTAKWVGGKRSCDHVALRKPPVLESSSTLGFPSDGGKRRIGAGNTYHQAYIEQFRDVCRKCGARRVDNQIGIEATPEEYVGTMVDVFRECRRVLRRDGTLWLNLGDRYAATTKGSSGVGKNATNKGSLIADRRWQVPTGLKPKDLVGIPWRVAFALQADGWWLRSDIIWAKPNPMPESVRDRPTKSHEYLFLLTKSERYFYDQEAIAEPVSEGTIIRLSQPTLERQRGSDQTARGCPAEGVAGSIPWEGTTRNKRSVWAVTTRAFKGAHFATFPPALIEPCINAGCPADTCADCGAPFERRLEVESRPNAPVCKGKYDGKGKHRTVSGGVSNDARKRRDLGFAPTCRCKRKASLPGVVLDPFGGAATTGVVAQSLGRDAVLIELNPNYCAMGEERLGLPPVKARRKAA